MTRSDDFERSWLRSRRTVSWFVSTSSVPPATKPAISTRWNGVTSSFGWMGVSIGISYETGPHAMTVAASAAAESAISRLWLFLVGSGPVIDFLEQLIVLPNLEVVGFHLHRLLVSAPCFVQLSFVFVGDSEIVEGSRVGRVDFDGAFPAIDRLFPKAFLRHVDAERHLRLRVAPRIGERRCGAEDGKAENAGEKAHLHEGAVKVHYSHSNLREARHLARIRHPVEQAMCHARSVQISAPLHTYDAGDLRNVGLDVTPRHRRGRYTERGRARRVIVREASAAADLAGKPDMSALVDFIALSLLPIWRWG